MIVSHCQCLHPRQKHVCHCFAQEWLASLRSSQQSVEILHQWRELFQRVWTSHFGWYVTLEVRVDINRIAVATGTITLGSSNDPCFHLSFGVESLVHGYRVVATICRGGCFLTRYTCCIDAEHHNNGQHRPDLTRARSPSLPFRSDCSDPRCATLTRAGIIPQTSIHWLKAHIFCTVRLLADRTASVGREAISNYSRKHPSTSNKFRRSGHTLSPKSRNNRWFQQNAQAHTVNRSLRWPVNGTVTESPILPFLPVLKYNMPILAVPTQFPCRKVTLPPFDPGIPQTNCPACVSPTKINTKPIAAEAPKDRSFGSPSLKYLS